MAGDLAITSDSQLKGLAREQLAGRWGDAVIAGLLYSIITGAAAGFGGIGNLIVGGPMELGLVGWFLALGRTRDPKLEDLFTGFRKLESTIVLYIVRMIFIALWSLLLIVPGIVAAMRYSMASYILHDEPGLSGMEALRRSAALTEGYKGRLFGLYLSFIGWAILCALTLGIGYLWLFPYLKATEANFYEALKVTRSQA